MNKYNITVTVVASGAKYGYIAYGSSTTDATNVFLAGYPGFNTSSFTVSAALAV